MRSENLESQSATQALSCIGMHLPATSDPLPGIQPSSTNISNIMELN